MTPQEEMLLSAMRAKRALMRGNQQIGDGEAGVSRTATSKKDLLPSTKTATKNSLQPAPQSRSLHARKSSKKPKTKESPEMSAPNPDLAQAPPRPVNTVEEEEDILTSLDLAVSSMDAHDSAERGPESCDHIIDFDAEQFPTPPKAKHTHSRNSSTASAAGRLTHSKMVGHSRHSSFGRPRPDSQFLPSYRHASPDAGPPLPFHKGGLDAATRKGKQTSDGTPWPSSPLAGAFIDQEDARPQSRKKAVRISAVGLPLPEIGQWGDDG